MEETKQNKEGFYRRFLNSKAFYPVMLSLIAALSISIWAVNRSNKILTTTVPYSQGTNIIADLTDEQTTAVQNSTASAESTSQTQKVTNAYETNEPFKGEWLMPVKGKISKDYSAGKLVLSKTMGDYRVHNGIDIAAKKGETVRAVNSGKVIDVYSDAFWGTTVVVDHGGNTVVKYSALQSADVPDKGDILQKGDKIGLVDTIPCEGKDESHVHIEITVKGQIADPLSALNQNNNNE